MTWTAPRSGDAASSYEVLTYRLTSRTLTPIASATCTSAALSCTVRGLTNGKRYVFAVVAVNSTGRSNWPTFSDVTVPRTKPSAPRSIHAKKSDGWTKVSWRAPRINGGDQVDKYRVLVSLNGDSFHKVHCEAVGGKLVKQRKCRTGFAGGKLRFKVQAHNDAGWSRLSKSSNTVYVPAEAL